MCTKKIVFYVPLWVTHFLNWSICVYTLFAHPLLYVCIPEWPTTTSAVCAVGFCVAAPDYSYLKLTSGAAADVDWLRAEGRKKKFSETNYGRARSGVGEKLPPRLNWLIIWRQASQSAAVQSLQRVFAICLRPAERGVRAKTTHITRRPKLPRGKCWRVSFQCVQLILQQKIYWWFGRNKF